MKFPKLFVSALMGCVLVGASDAAMARNDCLNDSGGTSISGGTFDELFVDEFVSCTLVGVIVEGDVRVIGANDFTMTGSDVKGNVIVTAVVTQLQGNKVGGRLVLNRFRAAIPFDVSGAAVLNNLVSGGGNVNVSDGTSCERVSIVYVAGNHVLDGNLRVNCNDHAFVRQNTVINGNISCRDNDKLDASDNVSLGGSVNCSKGVSDGIITPPAE